MAKAPPGRMPSSSNPIQGLRNAISDERMKQRFEDVLGNRASQFLASVVSAVSSNASLQKASPNSILASAFIAATLNLDINPSLGFSAIVPYNKNSKKPDGSWQQETIAQFQIMTKGFIQLAIRSQQYRNINVTEIYKDEYRGMDIISGEPNINPVAGGMRSKGRTEDIAGYAALIETVNGFRKVVFWDMDKIMNHAKRFSKSWDSRNNRFMKGSAWDAHFEAMCRKTVLKNALSTWGVLSTQMETAIKADQAEFLQIGHDAEISYPDGTSSDEDFSQIEAPAASIAPSIQRPQPTAAVEYDAAQFDDDDYEETMADIENDPDFQKFWNQGAF